MASFKWHGWYTALIVLAVFGFIGISFYGYVNGVRNDGISMEQQLTASYSDNENYLSNYISKFYEQTGIAKFKSAQMDTILTRAVQGRYGPNGFSAQGAFFSAVKEAYPDLTQLNVFDRIMETVSAGRDEFKGRQSILLDQIRAYDTWRQQGLVRHILVTNMGFPSDNIKAQVGSNILAEGAAALTKMRELVLTSSTTDAYTSGKMEPLQIK